MNDNYRLEVMRFLDEIHLSAFSDSFFRIMEDEYVNLDQFEKDFKSLCLQLPLEDEWFERKLQSL